jgi:hypothetical protein
MPSHLSACGSPAIGNIAEHPDLSEIGRSPDLGIAEATERERTVDEGVTSELQVQTKLCRRR